MLRNRIALPLLLLALATTTLAQSPNVLYVSTSGSDANNGTPALPKKSVAGALSAMRQMRANGTTGQFVIQIASGVYQFDQPLALNSTDGGSPSAPLIIRGESKDVYFDGSKPVSGWQRLSGTPYYRVPVAARDLVFMAQLPGAGNVMTEDGLMDTGSINRRGFPYQTTQTWSTLVFNGQAMDLAKHPNSGWLTIPTNHDGSQTSIELSDATPYSWQNTGNIWAYGYFGWDWADSFEPVSSFSASTGRVNLATQPYYGIRNGQRYVLVNAIEAIDAPNEYFVDRAAGVVYFYPPLSGLTDADKIASLNAGVRLSSLDTNLVETSSTNDVSFENITFQNGRRSAVTVRYGNRVSFKGCTFKRFNYHAVIVVNGFSHLFQSCDFYDLDETALVLNGGDRVSLTPSNHLIVNCSFRDYSKLCRTYRPAIDIWGVGNTVRNCRIENAPHSGVVLHGNNNVVEKSEFLRLCLQTSDSGAVYIGRNPTFQGNRVNYNRFQDIWTQQSGNYSNFTAGVYMDDMAGGTNVNMNLFKNVQIGIVMGGGSDVKLDNNYFLNNGKAVHFDARGTSWASNFFTAWNIQSMLNEVPYQQTLWASQYPNLANYLYDDPATPGRDTLTHSVNVGSTDWLLMLDGLTTSSNIAANPPIYSAFNSVTTGDPGFADMSNENFSFQTGSTLSNLGIQTIDTSLMGLYNDAFRTLSGTPDPGGDPTPPPPTPEPTDTTAPTTPDSLMTASGPAKGQVTLKWGASSDDSGSVAKYEVFRSNIATSGFALIGSTATLKYVDNAGRGKKRYYYIVAVDAAGNRSQRSAINMAIGLR